MPAEKRERKKRVREVFKNNFEFIDEQSLNHIHSKIEGGTTTRELRNHLLTKYPNKLEKNKKLHKKLDNILQNLSGNRRGRSKKPSKKVIEHSENRYLDPGRENTRRVYWWGPNKKKADKAGLEYQKMIPIKKPEAIKRKVKRTSKEKDINRYKKRLLNENRRITRRKGEEHEEILEKALNQVVGELIEKGFNEKQVKSMLSGDRQVMKDLLDMEQVQSNAQRNMAEILKNQIKGDPKELTEKQLKWIYERHLDHEIAKTWERKVERAIKRKKGSRFLNL